MFFLNRVVFLFFSFESLGFGFGTIVNILLAPLQQENDPRNDVLDCF